MQKSSIYSQRKNYLYTMSITIKNNKHRRSCARAITFVSDFQWNFNEKIIYRSCCCCCCCRRWLLNAIKSIKFRLCFFYCKSMCVCWYYVCVNEFCVRFCRCCIRYCLYFTHLFVVISMYSFKLYRYLIIY